MKIINSSGQHRRGILGKWTIKITGISEVYGFGIVDLAHAGSCVSGYAWTWVLNAGKLISKLRHLPLHPFQRLQRRGIHGHECWSAPHHTYHRRNCWRTWDSNPFCLTPKYWLYSQTLMSMSLHVAWYLASILLNYVIILVGHR